MKDGLEPGLDPALADITDDEMFDTLEAQYERGEPLNPEFVWEIHKRTIAQNRTRTAELRHELESAEAERDRLRALIKGARDARDPTIAVGLPPEEIGRGVRSYLEAVDRLLAEGVTDDEHFVPLYESGESANTERDRMRAAVDAAHALVEALDTNPMGEYGDAVCEAIDLLDAKLKAVQEGT